MLDKLLEPVFLALSLYHYYALISYADSERRQIRSFYRSWEKDTSSFFKSYRMSFVLFFQFFAPKFATIIFELPKFNASLYLKLLYLSGQRFIRNRILFDFRNHNLIDEINFPKLLIIAYFLIVFRIDQNIYRIYSASQMFAFSWRSLPPPIYPHRLLLPLSLLFY